MSTTVGEPSGTSTSRADAARGRDAGFEGFLRADGRVGIRNHVVVLSSVALANRLAEIACAPFPDVVRIAGEFTRGLQSADASLQDLTLLRLASHPNVGALLVLTHDAASALRWRRHFESLDRPAESLAFMDCHGIADAIERTRQAIARLEDAIAGAPRSVHRISALTVALECGGSDASSAICANPAIGRFVDRLVAAGGTAIVSESAEFIGAEAAVRAQAADPDVAERVLARIAAAEERMARDGERYRGVNPTSENIEAGLTTLIEKSMGAVCKIGATPIRSCLDFGEPPGVSGLHFMDTPFFSPCSITGMVAGGAQLTLFAMGVFNPSGNPLAPTLKLCGNPRTVATWHDGIDLNLQHVADGTLSLERAATLIEHAVLACASGLRSKTECWGEGQFIVPKTLPSF